MRDEIPITFIAVSAFLLAGCNPASDTDSSVLASSAPVAVTGDGGEVELEPGIRYRVIEPAAPGANPAATQYVRIRAEMEESGDLLVSSARDGEITVAMTSLEASAPGLARAVAASPVGERRRWTIAPELMQPGNPGRPVTAPVTLDLVVVAGVEALQPPADLAAPPADATTTASGLAYKRLSEAAPEDALRPAATDTVRVHYTGWRAEDGDMFDSSVMRGVPAAFPLDRVIAGWTEGLQLMAPGERFRFWIPGSLAYDGSSRPGAPRGTLVFDVELLEILPGD